VSIPATYANNSVSRVLKDDHSRKQHIMAPMPSALKFELLGKCSVSLFSGQVYGD
jgi:hypothetical protein